MESIRRLIFAFCYLLQFGDVNGVFLPKNVQSAKFKIIDYNTCIESDKAIHSLVSISFQDCLDACEIRSDCRAVNYHRSFPLCELFSNDFVNFIVSKRQQTCISMKKDDTDIANKESCSCTAGMTCNISSTSCSNKECRPLLLENGEIFGNMNSVGSRVAFHCNENYTEIHGKHDAVCQPDRTWSYYPKCKRACKEQPTMNNATRSNGDNYEGQSRTYTCHLGLLFSSGRKKMTSTCQSDGQWSEMVCPTETNENSPCTGCILPRDCQDIQVVNETKDSGVYVIYPTGSNSFSVRCDMDTPPGGWTVIQRRISDSDFYLPWKEYKEGFGNLSTNFWLGNEKIWRLSNSGNYALRVDLIAQNGDIGYTEYNSFKIGDEASKYTLNISGGIGPAGDSLHYRHNGMKFSTSDQDNDIYLKNCATMFTGSWWYQSCQESNLNGLYGMQRENYGITWKSWKNASVFMTFTEMKLRRNKK